MIPLAFVALAITGVGAFGVIVVVGVLRYREVLDERRAINRRVAYYGGRDAMDRPFLDG